MIAVKKKCITLITWIVMLTKRYLKNPMFLIALCAIPAFVIGLKAVGGTDEAVVRVALFANENATEYTTQSMDSLINDKSGAIVFYRTSSQEKLIDEVKSGYANCGFIFPDDLENSIHNYVAKKLSSLQFDNGMVKLVDKEQTNYVKIAKEVVIASFYEKFAYEVRNDFLAHNKQTADMSDEQLAQMDEYMDDYEISEEFFSYEYADGTVNKVLSGGDSSLLMLPVKGIVYVIILLAGMMGVVAVLNDREHGMFAVIHINRRKGLSYLYVIVPTVLAAVVGFAAIMISGVGRGIGNELVIMLLYIFLVTGTCGTLMRVFKGITLFVSIIPIFVLMNLILCPVFIDLASFVPELHFFRFILPVGYGLSGLYNLTEMLVAIAITNVICYRDI